jgi:hypothetical protein
MGENGRGHIEVLSQNIPWDRGKRPPVKILDVPDSIRTRQLTDARPLRLHSTRSVYLRIKMKYPIPNETFTDTFEWNDTNDKMWSCNMCAGMRIFFMCQLCDRDKIYWGHQLTLPWSSWPFKSNDLQWMNRYQFRKHKSQTEGSCKLCSLPKQFWGRITCDTAGNF